VERLSARLNELLLRYEQYFKVRSPNKYALAKTVLCGYLLLETARNYTGTDQGINSADSDGQKIQHFMSDSPWSWASVFRQVRTDIRQHPSLGGGSLHFDESGDEGSGPNKAGAARQYLGRLGKVEQGQVTVLSSYSVNGLWMLTGAELFFPQKWLD
jgi:SRSO17 transposase